LIVLSKPYDATSKDLIESDPAGWVTFLGCPVSPADVRLVDADVSTITADTDKVIRVDTPSPWLLHLELQARWEAEIGLRLLRYNALLQHRHRLPVVTVAVLLRSSAQGSGVTGLLEVRPPIGRQWGFPYEVLRLWERPPSAFLEGPLGLLPLAPLADVTEPELPTILAAMKSRLGNSADGALVAKLWASTYVLMGLRYDQPFIDNLLSGVLQMEESVTYQAIIKRGVQQGAVQEARKLVLLAGQEKLGPPSPAVGAAIAAITDTPVLETLLKRVIHASSWDDLIKPN
jgi:predicted transposase YdaD